VFSKGDGRWSYLIKRVHTPLGTVTSSPPVLTVGQGPTVKKIRLSLPLLSVS
jgi:hypothetical protein